MNTESKMRSCDDDSQHTAEPFQHSMYHSLDNLVRAKRRVPRGKSQKSEDTTILST